MTKAVVFISHISEEREIAEALKHVVEKAFLGMIEVFVSSDANSIGLGQRWLAQITAALKACAVEIIIASEASVKRPWINFEAGAGWLRDISVIPLCHSGMTPSKLPAPLNELQAALATNEDQLRRLFPVLAKAIGSQVPSIDWSSFVEAVNKFENESKQIKELEEKSPTQPTDGLLANEIAVLTTIARNVLEQYENYPTHQIHSDLESAGFHKAGVNLAIIDLIRKGLLGSAKVQVNNGWGGEEIPGQFITAAGWQWLNENKERLDLVNPKPKPLPQRRGRPVEPEEDIPF